MRYIYLVPPLLLFLLSFSFFPCSDHLISHTADRTVILPAYRTSYCRLHTNALYSTHLLREYFTRLNSLPNLSSLDSLCNLSSSDIGDTCFRSTHPLRRNTLRICSHNPLDETVKLLSLRRFGIHIRQHMFSFYISDIYLLFIY